MFNFFERLKKGLGKTRANLTQGIATLLQRRKTIDAELLHELEEQLLLADVGVEATSQILQDLTKRVSKMQVADAQSLIDALQADLTAILEPYAQPLTFPENNMPRVLLMVGINGAGKTTTIGKLAKRFQQEGKKVMLAAADTFRAAAIDQLKVWGERNHIPVVAQQPGADSAAVAFDALQAAQARHMDVLIVDTAGRLHTQTNLMEELKKLKRVLAKLDPHAPHEVLLVLDAGNGQNALNQAKQFHEAIGVTGLVLTKLDGTAKGGMIFNLAKTLKLPIRFIGVGESIDDLRSFSAEEFVAALFS